MSKDESAVLIKELSERMRIACEECDWPKAFKLSKAIDALKAAKAS